MRNIILIFILVTGNARAQETPRASVKSEMYWGGYYNSLKFKGRYSLNSDVQFRIKNGRPSQALVRSGFGVKLTEKVTLLIGAAHFRYYLSDVATRGEWRPWQELAFQDEIRSWKISHRFRVEERFNEKSVSGHASGLYTYSWRFRYKFDFLYPIFKTEKRRLYLNGGNEVMINAGKSVLHNYFDQDRLYAGLNFEYNSNFTFQLQGVYIWQQLSDGTTLEKVTMLRFNIYHTINL